MNKSLTVIIPFFRKVKELTTVFPLNKPYLLGDSVEVILCLDEPESADAVRMFAHGHPDVNWRVLVNRSPHPWRTPTKAINVGLRHAHNDYVLVVSPETKFVGNVPEMMLDIASPKIAVAGKLTNLTYHRFMEIGEVEAVTSFEKSRGLHYYGSICFYRQAAIDIGGYDECMDGWGGDDDNFRARLGLSGVKVICTPQINIVHLIFEDNHKSNCKMNTFSMDYIHRPKSPICPVCYPNWGNDFAEVLRLQSV